jgi:GR25 family glycosyltransferase involved in LPS biosynthesis
MNGGYMKILVLLLISISSIAYGGSFEDCFKKAKHKRDNHSILGIDMIYVINSKKNLKIFRQIKKDFSDYDVVPYRFDAVNPKAMSYKTLSTLGVKMINTRSDFAALRLKKGWFHPSLKASIMDDGARTYFSPIMTFKKIARNLDYLSVIYDGYKNNKHCIWVMEDNVQVNQDPSVLTSRLTQLDKADPAWDILYTDVQAKLETGSHEDDLEAFNLNRPDISFGDIQQYINRDQPIGDFSGIGLRSGAYSFILSRHGMKVILDYYHTYHFFVPFDKEILLIPGIHVYGLMDAVVTNDRPL